MAKVIRKELEQKLAALGGAEWDSMSESDLSGEDNDETVNETSDGEELKSPPLPLHAQQKKGKDNKRKGKGGSVVPVGPAGEPSGVVRIGHIPHGFYEEAMNGFFKQFGDVIRVRISRSKKSGRSKVRLGTCARQPGTGGMSWLYASCADAVSGQGMGAAVAVGVFVLYLLEIGPVFCPLHTAPDHTEWSVNRFSCVEAGSLLAFLCLCRQL